MILQRDRKIPVCGTGPDGGSVTVKLDDVSKSTTVVDNKWMVEE